jgi:hypothetical protein
MPHFKDDNITTDEIEMTGSSNGYHENAICIVNNEKTTLDAAFAELKAVLPDCTLLEDATQGLEDNKDANSIDFQDATLADLHRQSSILSSAINHLRYLERGREQLLPENKVLAATVNGLREGIKDLVIIEGAKVDCIKGREEVNWM